MAQKTDLNISPYYDDFDESKNFYKVLFKPVFPVQARELTTLQSILQNQVESFGSNIFKEGLELLDDFVEEVKKINRIDYSDKGRGYSDNKASFLSETCVTNKTLLHY